MNLRDLRRVAVSGGGEATGDVEALAEAVGRGLAGLGVALVTGGYGGAMEAACRGYKAAGGPLAIGILRRELHGEANPYVDVAVATGMGHARNALVVMNAEAVVALPGGAGTLSEVAFAGVYGRPVVGVASDATGRDAASEDGACAWEGVSHVAPAGGAAEAVDQVAAWLAELEE